ncbi:pentapeptide repeat-containing protein [Chroococcidiopsis sp. FACHB-1243]|uniref:pentapeptide repeat-containing protein n=1 Tax=Chroococcidiopsis sp. [FACHB-1243] TaxID=2692781 RepID=UPI0017803F96|nr:pentapeptide repeat-containing protein [Chroococcidiopsis sp. [FACHB-1243]]MBD2307869.1 pentapeptide repeat-containing protein [Chroococcidiopsis sp. [FACHB-1243]]
MAQVNRRKMSLYNEAKAGLSSLVKQTATVFLGLLVLLIVTSGSPPASMMGLLVLVGVGFVSWTEKRRLIESEEADLKRHLAVHSFTVQETQPNTDLTHNESQVRLKFSPNKLAVEDKCYGNTPKSLKPQEFLYLSKQIQEAQTDDFIELAKIAGLDPLKDFVRADLRNVDLSNANLTGINLSGAYLGKANLSGANLRNANLSNTVLSHTDLSNANLSNANLSSTIVYGANLSFAKLDGAKVDGSRFVGWNTGLTEDLKRDLQQRGAIFEDSAGDRQPIST